MATWRPVLDVEFTNIDPDSEGPHLSETGSVNIKITILPYQYLGGGGTFDESYYNSGNFKLKIGNILKTSAMAGGGNSYYTIPYFGGENGLTDSNYNFGDDNNGLDYNDLMWRASYDGTVGLATEGSISYEINGAVGAVHYINNVQLSYYYRFNGGTSGIPSGYAYLNTPLADKLQSNQDTALEFWIRPAGSSPGATGDSITTGAIRKLHAHAQYGWTGNQGPSLNMNNLGNVVVGETKNISWTNSGGA